MRIMEDPSIKQGWDIGANIPRIENSPPQEKGRLVNGRLTIENMEPAKMQELLEKTKTYEKPPVDIENMSLRKLIFWGIALNLPQDWNYVGPSGVAPEMVQKYDESWEKAAQNIVSMIKTTPGSPSEKISIFQDEYQRILKTLPGESPALKGLFNRVFDRVRSFYKINLGSLINIQI